MSKPLQTARIGVGEVIRGWDEAILKMSLGEKASLRIGAQKAFGPPAKRLRSGNPEGADWGRGTYGGWVAKAMADSSRGPEKGRILGRIWPERTVDGLRFSVSQRNQG